MLNLPLLTFHALRNILNNVLFHSQTKILLSGCRISFFISWVTRIWSLIDFIHRNPPQVYHIWNINYILISKKFISFRLISFVVPFKVFLLQRALYLHVHFILINMVNNLLPQIWLASTKRCHMHFMYLPTECINNLVLFYFLCLISNSNSHKPSILPSI